MNQVLFLCNRNVCSSRVAAALFNQVVQGDYVFNNSFVQPLAEWKAISRGLALDSSDQWSISERSMSARMIRYLESRGIDCPGETPLGVEPSDLLWSDRIVALDESEQGGILEDQFSFWLNRIEFWNVPDFHDSWDDNRVAKLEANVLELVSVIRSTERVASH